MLAVIGAVGICVSTAVYMFGMGIEVAKAGKEALPKPKFVKFKKKKSEKIEEPEEVTDDLLDEEMDEVTEEPETEEVSE